MKLAGRIALVTGAQQGIGAAIAVALAEEGADVTITWLDDELAAEAVAGRVGKAGRRVHLIRSDVARLADIELMVAETVRVLGAPDILVNNAGVYPRVKLLEDARERLGLRARYQPQSRLFCYDRLRQGAYVGRQARRVGDQHLLAGNPRCRAWCAL